MVVRRWILLLSVMLVWPVTVGAANVVNNVGLQQLQETITQAIAVVRPAVVSIKALKKGPVNGDQNRTIIHYESIGSGFIVDSRGFIVTNNHVVDGAESISVSLWRAQDNKFQAKLVEADQSLDLAVLKIDGPEPFTPAILGDSNKIEVGQYAINVGSPFGFEHTVTMGIISDLHRNLSIEGLAYNDMIQTDSVINQGNSGGPLIDISGRVIGIGTAIYAPSGTYTGLGFAIPVNRAKHFFSSVTGAVQAAMTTPADPVPAKEPISLTDKIPNDQVHQKFADCTTCHTITQKSSVNLQKPLPHPAVGACDTCHIMVNEPVAQGPIPVANVRPVLNQDTFEAQNRQVYWNVILKLAMIIFVASVVSTMLGLGGGFLYVPILLSCGVDFKTAAATSLVLITAAGLSGLHRYFKADLVDLELVMALEIPTMIGAFVGGVVSDRFQPVTLTLTFGAGLIVSAFLMLRERDFRAGAPINIGPWFWRREFNGFVYDLDLMVAAILFFKMGFVGGLIGVAGGWLRIPLMVAFFGIPMKIAVAASALMTPITALSASVGHSMVGHFAAVLAIPLGIITIIGAQVGARISLRTGSNLLRFLFSLVLGLVGFGMIFKLM
ncbi:MAG: TSUP family transporter [Deltaproteobacteria bacterium]|nr:TSUP family transporter [Deltaproteobacteria bacterium]